MDRQHVAFDSTLHRPWPLPQREWVAQQTWVDLLFAHWPVAPQLLLPFVPAPLVVDTFDSCAYVSITPFAVEHMRLRKPAVAPLVSSFLECNVRTYVTYEGKPGVWFFTLEASSLAAVVGARTLLNLPYNHARISAKEAAYTEGYRRVRYESRRRGNRFVATYGPTGPDLPVDVRPRVDFLCERYCLYGKTHAGRLYRQEIHHQPWPLQPAEVHVEENTLLANLAVRLSPSPTSVQFARRLDVVIYPPEFLGASASIV